MKVKWNGSGDGMNPGVIYENTKHGFDMKILRVTEKEITFEGQCLPEITISKGGFLQGIRSGRYRLKLKEGQISLF